MGRALGDILASLDLSAPFDSAALCQRYGRRRGRPIELVARPIPIGPVSGLLISYAARDVVVYQAGATRHHRNHIVYHEFCHLALGHVGLGATATCGPPAAEPDRGGPAGGREAHDREWEAEYGATLLSSWSEVPVRPGRSATPEPVDTPSSGLVAALGRRWA